ncbi:hypothetical protein AAK964_12155 [Tissierella praeacuta]|uniref:hypothetical protein n=1 Tax=Tissierella praeacuta TaxID=43131 RepID=UPI0035147F4A
MLDLREIKKNEKGLIQECFTTNNPRIKRVTFTYKGKDKFLDEFLKSIIVGCAKKQKIID